MRTPGEFVRQPLARTPGQADYEEYLCSPEWAERKERVLARDGHRCRVCNGVDELHVHHRTYSRYKRELDDDLTTLCSTCHGRFHDVERDSEDLPTQAGAAPPADKLYDALFNPAFAAAWNRYRPDFHCQEQYDLALARSAVNLGWADDEIAALIGCHRGWDQKSTRGYLMSTIRKVRRD